MSCKMMSSCAMAIEPGVGITVLRYSSDASAFVPRRAASSGAASSGAASFGDVSGGSGVWSPRTQDAIVMGGIAAIMVALTAAGFSYWGQRILQLESRNFDALMAAARDRGEVMARFERLEGNVKQLEGSVKQLDGSVKQLEGSFRQLQGSMRHVESMLNERLPSKPT